MVRKGRRRCKYTPKVVRDLLSLLHLTFLPFRYLLCGFLRSIKLWCIRRAHFLRLLQKACNQLLNDTEDKETQIKQEETLIFQCRTRATRPGFCKDPSQFVLFR